ncbi:glycoside hydrolase family 3 C-terminal domain-containing protein [Lutibacter sp. TH_r2]|uniref:beta-glucosidase n=1 Tax=Lutibacter sp. TH_r2 TaxID=3082083 RepID=UPI002953F0EF|nr:glycoside hydrolase family 3 C-terminal domain-containing protein [Lutibacter sp. TH_r2]MDV7186141.1 glycoside hydrolase family 3 C-terminal domain-containing protein [Lutibacter sp. TH_r2]
MKYTQFIIAILICSVLILFCSNNLNAQNKNNIDSILSKLTLKEKIAMIHAQSKFSTPGVPRLGIPELWMSDGPHGVRAEISWDKWEHAEWTNDSITAFPALTCLAATFNPKLSKEYGISLGEEARYRKKDVLLGPGVNIYRTPLNGRNFEYMGEDPYLASKMVVPYIQGIQQNGVAACVKHYALNNQEKWRTHINVEVSDRALHEIYLPAFKAAVEKGKVWSIMSAYNQFRWQYCSHNEKLNTILKKDWNFNGVIISDWGATHNTKQSALYGLDIEMGTGTDGLTHSLKNAYDNYYMALPLLKMVESGEIEEAFIDDKVKRILGLMFKTTMNKNRSFGKMNTKEHHSTAKKIASEGIVLLKNNNSFFPIDTIKKIKIAVIGENATKKMTLGGGSSELKAQFEISPLEGIQNKFKNATVLHAMGYSSGPSIYGEIIPTEFDNKKLKKEAIEVAKKSDIILYFGGLNKNHQQDCEGDDRKSFELPFGQNELLNEILKVNQNVGVVLISGNAVETPWILKIKALIQGWYLGSITGEALAEIISGDVNPSGKLPFSFPKKLKDNSAHYYGELSYPGDSINQYYKDDILVGYRWHDTKKIKPQFAFGEGLSYTTFKISNVGANKKVYKQDDKIIITTTVTNSGDREGAEVIQVYIGKPNSKVNRALKELKAFKKVHLEKGESKTIELQLNLKDLSYYNESISNWELEKGNYTIFVGNSSQNIIKKLNIIIK